MTTSTLDDVPIRVRIPADLDTPDRLLAGLTARQLALLSPVAVALYLAWRSLGGGLVPIPVLAAVTTLTAGVAVALAVGRRDGITLDRWVLAALTHRLRPRRLAPAPAGGRPALPDWAPEPSPPDDGATRRRKPGNGRRKRAGRRGLDGPAVGVLRLPADAISPDGVITTSGGTAVALVAATTVTSGLHTPAEQAGLMAGYGRWLNSLSGPVQVVVSARRTDLGTCALHIAEAAQHLPHPALARAAIAHAEHLLDLCEESDPLTRTVTIACTAPAAGEALRRAERTATALQVTGSRCQVLDAGTVTAVITAAVDPFGPGDPGWARTPPAATITAAPSYLDDDGTDADWAAYTGDDGPGGLGNRRSINDGLDGSGRAQYNDRSSRLVAGGRATFEDGQRLSARRGWSR